MRFGVEIELDATDGRDFAARPLSPGEMPAGADLVTNIVSDLGLDVEAHCWKHNHNNSIWSCKPDSSCGIELCSPVLDECRLGEVCKVMEALDKRPEITAGPNCALHVHVDISTLLEGPPESSESLCSTLAWWVKFEPVFLDSVPRRRRENRFCRCIGLTDLFDHEDEVVPYILVNKLKDKYLTLNTHHLVAKKRNSIEIRILEGTKDPELCASWVRLVLDFVRKSSAAGLPPDYTWSSLGHLEDLLDSDACSSWLRRRILENSAVSQSRFWRARSSLELQRLSCLGGFGQMSPLFIGLERDK